MARCPRPQKFEETDVPIRMRRDPTRGTRVATQHGVRFSAGVVVGSVLVLAGCPAGTLGSGRVDGSSGAGGSGSTFPGTVTLQVGLPPGQTFCDENPACTSTQHLWVSTGSGDPLSLESVGCATSCSACAPTPCPEIPVIACPAGSSGNAVISSTFTWDGSYVESGSCKTTSAVTIACMASKFAAPGIYVARFCATPGTLSEPDGGGQLCTPTGTQACVEVPFAFPSSQPVVISLPTGT
jgi:hypothetical protein